MTSRAAETLYETAISEDLPATAAPIFMTVQIDELKRRAAAGDQRAIDILLCLIPDKPRTGPLRARRDAEIKRLAADLRSAHPSMATRGVALLLGAAGSAIEAGGDLVGALFDELLPGELDQLRSEISTILDYAPATKTGERWPRLRMLSSIIGE